MNGFKIAITGVESTGKTTLANALGTVLNAEVVPEAARFDAAVITGQCTLETLTRLGIAQFNQCRKAAELAGVRGRSGVISDSDDTVLHVWGMEVFGKPPAGLECWQDWADLTLLCAPTIPWEADPLRSAPSLAHRSKLHQMYLDRMQDGRRWCLIDAAEKTERLDQAVRAFHTYVR